MERELQDLFLRWRRTARDLKDQAARHKRAGLYCDAWFLEERAATYERCADELAAVLGVARRGASTTA